MMMAADHYLAASDDSQFPLPGFRFHPTDEELVGFYLRRKVLNKAVAAQLIKQIDIYKYSPWDLPHVSNGLGDKEWYFFCKRGRKYKNSVRPNRVTGSGFWKATGIDKPIYSQSQHCIIGLKKTLVYYTGSAGRGTKTEWMMNEFRLPSKITTNNNNLQEAEIWTLCRIFKRNVSARKAVVPAAAVVAKSRPVEDMNFGTAANFEIDRYSDDNEESSYISFGGYNSFVSFDGVKKGEYFDQIERQMEQHGGGGLMMRTTEIAAAAEGNWSENVSPASSSFSDFDEDATDLFGYEKWEELKSILESDLDS